MSWSLDDYALPLETAERLLSPALVVYLDRVRDNVARMLEHIGTPDRWRPHLKTTKLPVVWEILLDHGVRRFKCATTREAAVLLQLSGDADVLLAHPLAGANLEALAAIAASHPDACVSVLCEEPETAASAPEPLGLFVDVNPGLNRTGIPVERTDRILDTARAAGPRLRGLHFYEGQVKGHYESLLELAGRMDFGEIVTSGTTSVLDALADEGLARLPCHTVSPGTVVFHDLRTQHDRPELGLSPAAIVAARVVSRPADDIVTCDAGSKSLAAEWGDPCVAVLGRPDLVAMTPSEEHLPLRVTAGDPPARGEILLLVPRHVCPTVNLAEQAILIEGGRFVGTAEVTARAHDVLFADAARLS